MSTKRINFVKYYVACMTVTNVFMYGGMAAEGAAVDMGCGIAGRRQPNDMHGAAMRDAKPAA